jgi:hypothetical protein
MHHSAFTELKRNRNQEFYLLGENTVESVECQRTAQSYISGNKTRHNKAVRTSAIIQP